MITSSFSGRTISFSKHYFINWARAIYCQGANAIYFPIKLENRPIVFIIVFPTFSLTDSLKNEGVAIVAAFRVEGN